ncbi:hypothetical protein QJQ45_021981 [Haematococcus lacustris]|nr:hypothetical protein QJQ45_021981 [Haematococcus lacustris]
MPTLLQGRVQSLHTAIPGKPSCCPSHTVRGYIYGNPVVPSQNCPLASGPSPLVALPRQQLVHLPSSASSCHEQCQAVEPTAVTALPPALLLGIGLVAVLQGVSGDPAAAATSAADSGLTDAAGAAAGVAAGAAKYVPSAYQPGWEVWVGLVAGVVPFAIGSYEFGKRIIIQLRCELCGGRGLVPSTNPGAKYLRKCPTCGGFFPWVSWKMFLSSTAAPGNGGPLLQPKGQTSVLYQVPAAAPTPDQVAAARAKYMSAAAREEGGKAGPSEVGEEACHPSSPPPPQ